eukprot:scaffold48_cov395-Prasinococcus_capsulatus_cf.AAC.5
MVNCTSVEVQCTGSAPTIAIDNTSGCKLFLSKECLKAAITTAKSSEINVAVPSQTDPEDMVRSTGRMLRGCSKKVTPSFLRAGRASHPGAVHQHVQERRVRDRAGGTFGGVGCGNVINVISPCEKRTRAGGAAVRVSDRRVRPGGRAVTDQATPAPPHRCWVRVYRPSAAEEASRGGARGPPLKKAPGPPGASEAAARARPNGTEGLLAHQMECAQPHPGLPAGSGCPQWLVASAARGWGATRACLSRSAGPCPLPPPPPSPLFRRWAALQRTAGAAVRLALNTPPPPGKAMDALPVPRNTTPRRCQVALARVPHPRLRCLYCLEA